MYWPARQLRKRRPQGLRPHERPHRPDGLREARRILSCLLGLLKHGAQTRAEKWARHPLLEASLKILHRHLSRGGLLRALDDGEWNAQPVGVLELLGEPIGPRIPLGLWAPAG